MLDNPLQIGLRPVRKPVWDELGVGVSAESSAVSFSCFADAGGHVQPHVPT